MANRSKQKGTGFESAVVAYLRDHGQPRAERRAQRGARDGGDIAGIDQWCCELKATRTLDLAGAVKEADTARANTGAQYSAAVIKRRGHPIAQAYVVMSLEQWATILEQLP